jgi:hypothetical protein
MLTTAHLRFISWAKLIQSTIPPPHFYIIYFNVTSYIIIITDFPIEVLCIFLVCPMHAACLVHTILLHFITLIISGVEYKLLS